MNAAAWPRPWPNDERLLVVDPACGRFDDAQVADLTRFIRGSDLLVVNDAATLPASLSAQSARGERLELRLIGGDDTVWRALAFGSGDFRTRTEHRPPPPELSAGDQLTIGDALRARVISVDGRLLELGFDASGARLWQALYAHGRPIQYAHVPEPLSLWHLQTRFASRPWAFEMPSAGRPLSWELISALLDKGVRIARVTHAAGISSTGSEALDRRLPIPERSEVSVETKQLVAETKQRNGRVIAVGTSVVRALESRVSVSGELRPGRGEAELLIGPGFVPRVADGLLTGMHPPGTSHFAVMAAFAPAELLERALAHADRAGYLEHEFGDSCLVLADSL